MTDLQLGLDQALAEVEANAPDDWWAQALQCAERFANSGRTFTADDIFDEVGKPPEPRALGAILKRLSVAGRIERVGETRSRLRRGNCSVWCGSKEQSRAG